MAFKIVKFLDPPPQKKKKNLIFYFQLPDNHICVCSDHDSVISTHTEKGQTLIILDLKPGDNYQPEPILRYTRP